MKSFTLWFVLILAGLVLAAGCRRETSGESRYSSYSSGSRSYFPSRGFAAMQNIPAYDLSGGSPEWIGAADFGDEMELDPEEIQGKITPGKSVQYQPKKYFIDDTEVTLIPVLWRGRSCWINPLHYAPENASAGVVIVPVIFLGDNRILRMGDLAVFDKDRLFSPFFGVHVNNIEGNKNGFSFHSDDVEAAKLMVKAGLSRNSERAQTLLRQAQEMYPHSALVPAVSDMLNPKMHAAEQATEILVALFSVSNDPAPVYAAPDFSSPVTSTALGDLNIFPLSSTTTASSPPSATCDAQAKPSFPSSRRTFIKS